MNKPTDLDESHTLWQEGGKLTLYGKELLDPNSKSSTELQMDAMTAAQKLENQRRSEALDKEKKAIEFANQVNDLDWKKLPPPLMAQILRKIPRKAKVGEPAYYLTLEQALVFALRCYELDLSPLSTDVFFMSDTWTVSITTSGKRKMARKDGLNLSAPQLKEVKRPLPKGRSQIFGYSEDIGYECQMAIDGDWDHPVCYTAYLSEWGVESSLVWKQKPMHMLQIRATEKCISFASGSGISDMPDEKEIEPEPEIKSTDIGTK